MKNFVLSFWVVLLAFSVQAQSLVKEAPQKAAVLQVASPAAAGISAQKLAKIDGLIQEYVQKGWIAGATAFIAKDGKIIYYKGLGYDDIDTKKPLAKDAIFRIASQTKAITSVGIMMLIEEGKLNLDDPVSKFIPEFKNPRVLLSYNAADTTYTTVPARKEITIRELLTHTSGIGYAQIGSPQMTAIYAKAGVVGGIGVDNILLGDKIKVLGGLPLFHQPGEKWTYGLNTDVLGYVIEVVSGKNLDQFFRQRIFEPLGMKDTYFYLPPAKRSRLAQLYTEDENGRVIKPPHVVNINGNFYPDFPAREGTYFSGGGGLSSTAYDYGIFMQMLLNGGTYNGKRLLSESSIRQMTTNQVGDLWAEKKFGLGFELATEESKNLTPLSPGSFYWGGMFSSSYWIDPKEKIIAQLYLQQYPQSHREVHDRFKTLVYAALQN